ncbi:DUF5343 domain-containing protein [Mesorhizobium sp. 43Arga]
MAVTADRPAPYAPTSAILSLIERHRNKGLPPTLDSDVLARSGISGSLIPRTLQAMQTLDLIGEDGKLTPTLEALRLAPEAEYKARLAEWLNGAYADALRYVDPSVDDEIRIRDAFRSYSPVGQQARMVTLFTGLFAAAGIAPERQRAAPRKSTRSVPNGGAAASARKQEPKVPRKLDGGKTDIRPLQTGLPPALSGLLVSLPANGDSWTKAERDRFVATFGAVLDFCFPVDDRPKQKIEQENSDGGER